MVNKKGKTMTIMKQLLAALLMLLSLATAASARDWDWTSEYREFARGEVLAALPEELKQFASQTTGTLYGRWEYAVAPAGLNVWISEHCARMIAAMGVDGPTDTARCVTTHFLVNGRDPGVIDVGERWLLWSPDNDPAVVQAAFAARDAGTAIATGEAAEAPLTWEAIEERLQNVVVTMNLSEEGQALLEEEVRRQLALIADDFTVTDETIKELLAAVLLERGDEIGIVSLTAFGQAMEGVDERLDALSGRMDSAEAAIAEQARVNTDVTARLDALAAENATAALVLEGHADRLAAGEERDRELAAAQDALAGTVAQLATQVADTQAAVATESGERKDADAQAFGMISQLFTTVGVLGLIALAALAVVIILYFTKASKAALAAVDNKVEAVRTQADMAIDMLFDGAKIVGELPSKDVLAAMTPGTVLNVTVNREGVDHVVTFTRADKGFDVAGIDGHRGNVAPENLMRVLAKAARRDNTDFTPEAEKTVLAPLSAPPHAA